jgi:hypothetical protein
MTTTILNLFLALVSAAAAEGDAPAAGLRPAESSPVNPVLAELTKTGVAMPDGSAIPLPAPILTDGMSAAEQEKAIAKAAGPAGYQRFVQTSSSAPLTVKVRAFRGKGEDATFRAIDLWFVAHGDWNTLTSKDFTASFTKNNQREQKNEGGALIKSGFLTEAEMQKRGLDAVPRKDGQEERFFYTTFTLFDRVEVSATRYAVLTRTPRTIVLATKVDPRFAKDTECPNQWRSIDRDAAANVVYGPKHPYRGAGFYVKIDRLASPAGAILVEYHSVFHEPQGWFEGENLLRAKLPTIADHEVKQFRGRLAKASSEKGK